MENLDKLTTAGCSLFDVNAEYLNRTDWSTTNLGSRNSWPQSLTCLVHLITTFPHAAAIFWGVDLSIVHNLAWGKATGKDDGQGATARQSYSGEALSSLHSCVRGRTVKVACRFFLSNTPEHGPDSTILMSTILDENGSRAGVLAQLLHNHTVERHLPPSSLDKLGKQDQSDSRAKPYASQQRGGKHEEQVDTKQTQLFQRFAELLPNGLAILDSDAEAVFVNDTFFQLTTNSSAKEFQAWPESIDSRDYERVMSAYRKAFSSREELRVEFRCAATENEDWRLFLLRPLSEEPEAGFICAVVDITEIKHAELAQEKAATEAQERKEQQERFIDMVSHEIRNPLSAVLHLAEEIKDMANQIEKNYEKSTSIADILDAADTILLCVSHQNTLVDDILSFSKLDSMMLSLVPRVTQPKWDFSQSLKVFNSEFKAKRINFHYAMDVSYQELKVDYVIADLNRMKQVLVNLITNAIKFTSKKDGERKIFVSVGASTDRPTSYPPNVVFFETRHEDFHLDSTLTAEWGGGETLFLMVAIKDTGIGISAEGQAKLFERFRQATPKTQEKYGGSGLGLFISRKLCQLHGGDIGVSSKEGVGSTFGFFFKVRVTDGPGDDGHPGLRRSISHLSSDGIPSPLERRQPGYGRSNSTLEGIPERPKIEKLASQPGIGDNDVPRSLRDPPVEFRAEAHPTSSQDERYHETDKVAQKIETKRSSVSRGIDKELPDTLDRASGESSRQASFVEETARSHSQEKPNSRPTLLLVEDNLINQKVLRRQLQSRGFEVFVANNGQEAIDAVKERGEMFQDNSKSDEHNYFDCILMDQEMPIKDGNAATMEIRELQEDGQAGRSPILGVSANVREAQTTSMREAGMDEVISKPFKVDELVKRIRGLLPNR